MKQQLLLLEDVDGLGRSGDVVSARRGFIRNFLLPQKKAVIADKHTLRMQERLKQEREQKAAEDRKEAEEMAARLDGFVISIEVKVDPDGRLYGSVTTSDIARMMKEKGFDIERKHVILAQPIKTLGTHTIQFKLKEGVPATISLEVNAEGASLATQSL